MSTIEDRDNGIYTCPIDKDGKFIRPGETLYGGDGKAWKIKAVGPTFCYADEAGRSFRLRNEWLTHERPDGWQRLLDDIARMLDGQPCAECAYFDAADCDVCPAKSSRPHCNNNAAAHIVVRAQRIAEADHD